jgi:hypothetical protein
MTFDSAYIDRIVQSVMQDLASRSPVASARCSASAVAEGANETPLHVAARVITGDVLTAARAGGRTITVPAGAVFTPTGRDFIRKHQVRIASASSGGQQAATGGFLITIGPLSTCCTAAQAAGWKTEVVGDEHAAAALAATKLQSGVVACCGGEPSIVACLLNRNPATRAAVITRNTNLQTLSAVMSPQVVCLESSGWSFGELLKLMRLLTAGSQPRGWREL